MASLSHLLLSFLAHHVSGNHEADHIGDHESIFIMNAGFETDFYPIEDNTYHYTLPGDEIPIVTGWERYNPANISVYYDIGITNPTGGTSMDDPVFKDGVPEGHQCVLIDQETTSLRDLGEIGLEQILEHRAHADTTYILSVWVGNSASNEWSNSSDYAGFWNYTGFPGYKVELVAYDILDDRYIVDYGTILAQDDNSLSIDEGIWKQSIVTVTIRDGDPNIGKTLGIRLINKNIDNGREYGMDVFFDDVRLEGEKAEKEEEEEEGEGDLKAGESGKKKKSSAGIIIVVILLILVVFCVIGVIVYKKNKKSEGRAYVPDMDEIEDKEKNEQELIATNAGNI